MSERAKPFVAYMDPGSGALYRDALESKMAPLVSVVVTPLLPDDPKPGETWLWNGSRVEIMSPPFVCEHVWSPSVCVQAETDFNLHEGRLKIVATESLRRSPALKTFRIREGVAPTVEPCRAAEYRVEATSREEAVRKLADALEEV